MDWLTQLLAQLQMGGAQAAPAMGAGGMAGDLGMGAIPGGGMPTPGGFDNTGVGAPMGPPGLPPSATPVVSPIPQPAPPTPPPATETLGASLEPGAPNGSPMDLRSLNQKRMGGTQTPPAGPQADKIVQALRGIQPPKPPDVVKPSTPPPPQLKQIQSGDLIALIQSLSNPRQPMQRPTTLGGALGIGRY